MRVFSPVAAGNGATVVHEILSQRINGYEVTTYNPWLTLFPPFLTQYRKKDVDLIHTAAEYAFLLSPPSVPLVITFHNFVLDEFMRNYSSSLQWLHYRTDLKYFIQRSLRQASLVTAVSDATADLVKHEMDYRGEIITIPNGVDTEIFRPSDTTRDQSDEIRVLFSGNPSIRKGAQWLFEIAKRLSPGIKIICTSGLSKRWKLADSDRIEVVGNVPFSEMPKLYNSADILLMPSVREGLSLAILEAMACGLPVVTTDCSSMPELVKQGKGGYLCPIGDVDDFAQRINQLAASARMRGEMGEYNRGIVERSYSQQRMVNSYRDLFNGLA